MEVVVPLRVGDARRAGIVAHEQRRAVRVVLENDVDLAFPPRAVAQRRADLAHDVDRRVVVDGVDRVHAQPVGMELLDPVERVVDEEIAHGPCLLAVEIDRRAPRCRMGRVEELRAPGVQVVAIRAEVVVDHVDQHHQAERVRAVDERLHFVGRAVRRVGREWQHPVVAPVAAAGEIGERHQLDRGDAELGQVLQPLGSGDEGAFGGEGADVELVDHGLGPRPAAPAGVAPRVGRRVDDFARGVHVVGIRA